jgi:transcriptional regulator with XRE-family HTH domain
MGDMDDAVGARLREARTRRHLSLQQVEAVIKIRPRYLRAIETEDWDALPSETYARAFVRTYGNFLGLDGERLAEEQRQRSGAIRPGERLPRVDPRPRRLPRQHRRRERRLSPRVVTALVTALVVAALIAIGLFSGSSRDEGGSSGERAGNGSKGQDRQQAGRPQPKPSPAGHELQLIASGEVWICLLDGRERPLLDGVILAPGEEEGPFRSGSFLIALGNGAVTMTVDGRQQDLPKPASPIGFAVDPRGVVREIPEGERPTCT